MAQSVPVQRLHARLQDRQLGDAAQVQAHAGAQQHGFAPAFVEHDLPVVHQRPLACQLGSSRDARVVFTEVPPGEGADGNVECATSARRQRCRRLQHCHQFRRDRYRLPARCALQRADLAVGPVARHPLLQARHLGKGGGDAGPCAQVRTVLHHDIDLCAQQAPRCARDRGIGQRRPDEHGGGKHRQAGRGGAQHVAPHGVDARGRRQHCR
ncbi:hypothetical protein D9M72_411860 [compost metagenome]